MKIEIGNRVLMDESSGYHPTEIDLVVRDDAGEIILRVAISNQKVRDIEAGVPSEQEGELDSLTKLYEREGG